MARKRKPTLLLDTSAVLYHLHGHSLQQKAYHDAIKDAQVVIPVFVRMEYLRGLVLNLIELWALIRESDTVRDALIDWSHKIHQERKLKVVLLTIPDWFSHQEADASREKSLSRLGELILRLINNFDDHFPDQTDSQLGCVLGLETILRQPYDDDLLLDFHSRFTRIQRSTPDCHLCEFRQTHTRRLRREKIDLGHIEHRQTYSRFPGFLRLQEQFVQMQKQAEDVPSCGWCERLGDLIIAIQADKNHELVTADRAFHPLGELLNRRIHILPSLAELKRLSPQQKPED